MSYSILSDIRKFFGCDYIVPVGSGSVGLYLALQAINVRGKRVILPVLTCPNVIIAILAAGGIPAVVDVSAKDYNITGGSILKSIDSTVAAIVVVNSFGYPVDMEAILRIANEYGCMVIEDACQAYGGTVDGVSIGSRADIGIISFGYSKPVSLNAGGLLIVSNSELSIKIDEIIRSWRCPPFVSTYKNRIALGLMLSHRYGLLNLLSRKMGLLNYNFPSEAWRALPGVWHSFVNQVPLIRSHLMQVHRMLINLSCVETFSYQGNMWVPWRYSFKIRKDVDVHSIRQSMKAFGIGTSQLYPSLAERFHLQASECINACYLTKHTINLRYNSNVDDTSETCKALERWSSLMSGVQSI